MLSRDCVLSNVFVDEDENFVYLWEMRVVFG